MAHIEALCVAAPAASAHTRFVDSILCQPGRLLGQSLSAPSKHTSCTCGMRTQLHVTLGRG